MDVEDKSLFYEWQGLAENWITSEESFDNDFPSQPYYDEEARANKPVSAWLVEDVFSLPLQAYSSNIGSKLPGYDIKSRDAYEMIRLSLAGELGENPPRLYECYANEEGEVGFYSIGVNSSNINPHILYSINSGEAKLKCDNVMVLGYDPPPKKYVGEERDLLTFAKDHQDVLNEYEQTPLPDQDPYYTGLNSFVPDPNLFVDPDRDTYPRYNIFGEVLGPEQCDYFIEGYIEYGDPMFSNREVMRELGVYDYTEYESVIGYIYKIDVDFYEEGMTDVQFSSRSVRFEELNGFGELQTRKTIPGDKYYSNLCVETTNRIYPDPSIGVFLPNSDNRKFLGVRDIYIYGFKVNLRPFEIYQNIGTAENPKNVWVKTDDCDFWASMDTMSCEPFRLSRGQDYVVIKTDESEEINGYKVVFSCNVDKYWLNRFGKEMTPPYGCKFRIDPRCILGNYFMSLAYDVGEVPQDIYYAPNLEWDDDHYTYKAFGWLRDGDNVNSETVYTATIFPTGEGNTGYALIATVGEQGGASGKLIAVYDWDNPAIVIKDQRPDKITEVNLKDHVSIKFYPIIIKDEPEPIALNGVLLDPTEIMPDYDPSTMQNLNETEYARAFSSLESGDIKVTIPFAEADQCITISNFIKSIQTDIADEVVYVCEPGAEPILGESYQEGVINAIDYSYQDSSQYLISVHVGPKWRGVGGWDNSIYKMRTENVQLEGKVVQVSMDNVKCRVFVKKIGLVECINGTRHILEKGDYVNVTLYNNPVSL